jgi:WD40 repeat protein
VLSGRGAVVCARGCQADAIIWDFETGEIVHRLNLHKVKVESLSFSPNEQFLATLGGQDDNNLVVWDVQSGTAICGSPAANDQALCVAFYNDDSYKLVTGGALNLRIWEIDSVNRKLKPFECNLGQTRRVIKSMYLAPADDFMYCGTLTGDIIEVSMHNGLLQRMTAPNDKFSQGVLSLSSSPTGDILVGAGDGTVCLVQRRSFRPVMSVKCVRCYCSVGRGVFARGARCSCCGCCCVRRLIHPLSVDESTASC